MRIEKLNWRLDRIAHIARHGIDTDEVEEVVFDDEGHIIRRGPRSEKDPEHYIYYFYGKTSDGRYIYIVLLDEGQGVALPITARDMTDRERRYYERG
ncbi:MAG TPA: hypothetical protein GX509_02385 [Firmicutes bacterium]|nr:hypothetical protein [Bacillota bacterium]HHY97569.1 hypothetical protein [Bacillota bacterium]